MTDNYYKIYKTKIDLQNRIDFITSMIRENRIDHARLKKELNELLLEFETPVGLEH